MPDLIAWVILPPLSFSVRMTTIHHVNAGHFLTVTPAAASRFPLCGRAPVGVQSESAVSDLAAASKVYRLASGGQDTAMCLWDIQIPNEGDLLPASLASAPTMT